MKARCPNNPDHKIFITVAHVTEDWLVDAEGNFLDVVDTGEVTHGPNSGNTWTCANPDCGAEAIVED